MEEFSATEDPARTTAILVHGNDTDARVRPNRVGGSFIASWSWALPRRADAVGRLVMAQRESDLLVPQRRQLKACRTNIEGYYLASFIDNLPAATPLTLGGYSYGARVVTGGCTCSAAARWKAGS